MTTICDLDDDSCGTGLEYLPTVREPSDPGTGGTGGTGDTTPSLTIAEIIDKLAGVIEFSHLAQSLRTRIDIINTLEHGFNEISTQVVTDNAVMAQQLIGLRGDLTNAVSYINNQTTIQLDERVALVNSVNQLVASLGDGLSAALQEESTVRAEQTGALFAEKTIKVDLAGNVAGFGLSAYVDETEAVSDFRVAADRFSIAPPAYVSSTPPSGSQLHDGKVWVDTSGGGKGVTKWWSASSGTWKLTPVAAAQPFVYLTTPQTLPDGTVVPPGLYVNSASITKLRADQIDTRGLTIKDATGKILFGGGTGLDWANILGVGKPEDNATSGAPAGTLINGKKVEDITADITASSKLLADISSDSKLTPLEKQAVLKEWQVFEDNMHAVFTEANKYPTLGTLVANGWDGLQNLGNFLNEYVPYALLRTNTPSMIDTAGLLVTSTISGIDFRWNWTNAYTQYRALLHAVTAEAAKTATWSNVTGTNKPEDGATKGAKIGHNVTLSDGSVLNSTDFVHRLSKINDTNISTFMSAAAIGNAYIGNAAVNTLKIAGESVTVPRFNSLSPDIRLAFDQSTPIYSVGDIYLGDVGTVMVSVTFAVAVDETLGKDVVAYVVFDGNLYYGRAVTAPRFNHSTQTIQCAIPNVSAGLHSIGVSFKNIGSVNTDAGTCIITNWSVTALTTMR